MTGSLALIKQKNCDEAERYLEKLADENIGTIKDHVMAENDVINAISAPDERLFIRIIPQTKHPRSCIDFRYTAGDILLLTTGWATARSHNTRSACSGRSGML